MPPTRFPFYLTPGIQLCVTKPVLLESECSMRQGHMGFLPTSSLPSSPSLEYIQLQPARQNKWRRTKGLCCWTNLQSQSRHLWGNESGLLLDRASTTSRYRMFTFLNFRSHASARCDTNVSLENLHINKVTGNKHILSTTDWFDWHQGKTYTNIIHRN